MKVILSLDCSTGWTALGLIEGLEPLGEITLSLSHRQSARLPALVDTLLMDSSKNLEEIDEFAVTTGPGYFTGIRVGLSYITGLAYALGKNVACVPTLLAMAFPYLAEGINVAAVLRARTDSLFAAIYRLCGGKTETVMEGRLMTPSEFMSLFGDQDTRSTIFVGNDLGAFFDLEKLSSKALFYSTSPVSGLAIAAIAASGEVESIPPGTVEANYYRGPDIGVAGARKGITRNQNR